MPHLGGEDKCLCVVFSWSHSPNRPQRTLLNPLFGCINIHICNLNWVGLALLKEKSRKVQSRFFFLQPKCLFLASRMKATQNSAFKCCWLCAHVHSAFFYLWIVVELACRRFLLKQILELLSVTRTSWSGAVCLFHDHSDRMCVSCGLLLFNCMLAVLPKVTCAPLSVM